MQKLFVALSAVSDRASSQGKGIFGKMKKRDSANELTDILNAPEYAEIVDRLAKIVLNFASPNGEEASAFISLMDSFIEFKEFFKSGAINPDSFVSLTDMEGLVLRLQEKQKSANHDLLLALAKNINEGEILKKKASEFKQLGIKLIRWRIFERSVVTVFGKVTFYRQALIPSSPEDADRLTVLSDKRQIFPLDEVLGIDKIPFKVSVAAMLETAYRVQSAPSYETAGELIRKNACLPLNDDTIRHVANYIGRIVFEKDCDEAERAWSVFNSGKMKIMDKKDSIPHVLYIEIDGERLQVRRGKTGAEESGEENESPFLDNNLAMVFSSDNCRLRRDKSGETTDCLGQKEYRPFLGEAEEFKKHVLALALRNGYGQYSRTIILSDGAAWIRNMKDEIFPEARLILDFSHLSKKIHELAKVVFNHDESLHKPWAEHICSLMKESKHKRAISEIDKLGTKKTIARGKSNLLNYILNNENEIDYARCLDKGWHIGGGERANKTALRQRLKQPGMRWNKETGQYV
ncbi:MAG: hypothetical protein LBJ64_12565, partial [Deltaproteobacteria bacterium]|nr:hypothetical protein [Deltaproteobacteria bacterium]